ncbi:hypothetical protein [Agrococcus lahaulensis]|uniref:hypothetical protein n=1 Tax=Agrococcus lahaulensis TaxID=341722 RepID=UPI0004792AFD|nr:hypothetical protein [Agrococcus lahaulensis]
MDAQVEASVARPALERSTTSPVVWCVVLALASALLLVRLPLFVDVAASAGQEAADALGDPALAAAATTVGAVSAIVLHVLVLVVAAVLATLLERWLGPAALRPARGAGRVRLGVAGVVLAVLVLGQQIAALASGLAAVPRGWQLWAAAAAVAASAPLAFPAARRSARDYLRALAAAAATGVLLCLG